MNSLFKSLLFSSVLLTWCKNPDINNTNNTIWKVKIFTKQNIDNTINTKSKSNDDIIDLNDSYPDFNNKYPAFNKRDEIINQIQNLQIVKINLLKIIKQAEINNKTNNDLIQVKNGDTNFEIELKVLKEVLDWVNFIIKNDKYWVINSKNWEVNNHSIKKHAYEYLKTSKTWIDSFIANAITYIWNTESNGFLQKQVNNSIKNLDNNSFDIKTSAWCSAFIRMLLFKSWFYDSANRINNIALSSLWIDILGFHVWIYVWGWRIIDWNSWRNTDKVNTDSIYRPYRKEWFIWWVMPWDSWILNKVQLSSTPIIWSIVVFATWKKEASKKAKKIRSMIKKIK